LARLCPFTLSLAQNGAPRRAGPLEPIRWQSNLIRPLRNLGELYYKAGQISRAEQLLSKALAIENASGAQPEVMAKLLNNLGDIYYHQHKDALAEQTAGEALKYFPLAGDGRNGLATLYSLLGVICLRAGRLGDAESWLHKSLAISESTVGAEDPRLAVGVANLAVFYSASGKFSKAGPLFERVKAIFDRSG
jgi:tetratricopeptide (TPR) repeat protein